jgi:MFS family permease
MSTQAEHATQIASEPVPAAAGTFQASNAYRYYVVWLLFAVYVLNFVDRQILSILNEQLKAEFGLSDTQLGILGGVAFATLYSVLGLPIARWADRSSRVNIIAVAIVVWSAFTAVTAYAKLTWHLVVARIGVGIGEAGCSPPAYSIISDYFDRQRRGTALSIYSMGVYGGSFIGLLIGGLVAEEYGWRMAFLVAGVPGILLAVIVKLTLREPPRGYSEPPGTVHLAPPPATTVMRNLWAKHSFRWLSLAAALHALAAYGVGHFYASFLVRSHGLGVGEVGQVLGVIVAVGGITGTFVGGYLSDRYCNRYNDIRYYLFVPAVLLAINVPVAQLVYSMSDRTAVLLTMVPYIALSAAYLAPGIAVTHRLVTVSERAVASAVLLLVINLIGLGLGPLVAGLVSDALREMFMAGGATASQASGDGLRWSLRLITLINVFSVWFYLLGARRLREDVV